MVDLVEFPSGESAQVFTPTGANTAATSHDITNISVWLADVATTYSYDTGDFGVAINVAAGQPVGVPSTAKTLTLGTSSAIAYMKK